MKVVELITLGQTINQYLQPDAPLLGAKLGYTLAVNSRRFAEFAVSYDKKFRELIEAYAVKNENGSLKIDENNNVTITDINAFNKSVEVLQSEEANFNSAQIGISEIPDSVPAYVISALLPLFYYD